QNYKGRGTKCDSSLNFNLEEDTLSVALAKGTTIEEDVLMSFVAKAEIAKEDAPSVVRHQIHNYKRRCMIWDLSSKS
ncbi:hypothetical protein H5410_014510, partial [Solanum commersonii]